MKNKTVLPRNIKVRLITILIQNTATISILPFMTLLLSGFLGPLIAGWILIFGIVLRFIFAIFGGYISDKLKTKKKFLVILTFVSALIFLIMGISISFIDYPIVLLIFVVMFLTNEIVISISNPIHNAFALDSLTENIRKEYAKIKYWISNVSIAAGMTLGGLFYNDYKVQLFIFIFCCLIINCFLLLLFVKEQPIQIETSNHKYFKSLMLNYKSAFNNRPFLLLMLGYILIVSAELSLASYVVVRLDKSFSEFYINGLYIDGVRTYSILMIINTVTVVCLSLIILRIISKIDPYKMLILSSLFYTIGYSVIISSNNFVVLLTAMFIATVGEIIYSPTYEAEKIKLIPKDRRGSYSALDSLTSPSADLISKLYFISGTIFTPGIMSILIFVITCFGFVILIVITKVNKDVKYQH